MLSRMTEVRRAVPRSIDMSSGSSLSGVRNRAARGVPARLGSGPARLLGVPDGSAEPTRPRLPALPPLSTTRSNLASRERAAGPGSRGVEVGAQLPPARGLDPPVGSPINRSGWAGATGGGAVGKAKALVLRPVVSRCCASCRPPLPKEKGLGDGRRWGWGHSSANDGLRMPPRPPDLQVLLFKKEEEPVQGARGFDKGTRPPA